ncbi:MAG: hypothetical protein AAFQ91_31775 [Cyanobacteria bacterium J06621_15]
MNTNKRKWLTNICCFISALVIVTIIAPKVGTAKQPQFLSSVSTYKDNILAYSQNTKTFGRRGNSGLDGSRGVPGSNGKDIKIIADGTAAEYDISGSNGKNGTNGNSGKNASSCRVRRRPSYSLSGANGGSGGDGGNGGNGGNGGEARIFYENQADLKKITLKNSGGKGGSPGRGAKGGYGCGCRQKQWTVNYCQWNLYRKRRNQKDAKWIPYSKKLVRCTGVKHVDERENYPSLNRYNSKTWVYRWEYKGVSNTRRYTCTNGKRGKSGSNGSRGRNGSYGNVYLVPRLDIPQEKTSYQGQVSQLLGKNIELVKNIWVRKNDLSSLLNAASDVPQTYTFLQETARPKYKIAWNASSTPADLGVNDTEIGAAIKVTNAKATIDFEIPGTLEYQQTKDKDVDVISITGGFSPSRVKSFEIENISGNRKDIKLNLIDKGDVRKLLQASSIQVALKTKQSASGEVKDNYEFRHKMTFQIPPTQSPSTGAIVSNNRYSLDIGSFFYPWLKPGYNTQFDVEITQKTKSGAVYTHSKSRDYQVPN